MGTTAGGLGRKLAPGSFHRLHRSYILNMKCIKEILSSDGGYVVVATDRDETHIPVARREVRHFREAVGI